MEPPSANRATYHWLPSSALQAAALNSAASGTVSKRLPAGQLLSLLWSLERLAVAQRGGLLAAVLVLNVAPAPAVLMTPPPASLALAVLPRALHACSS